MGKLGNTGRIFLLVNNQPERSGSFCRWAHPLGFPTSPTQPTALICYLPGPCKYLNQHLNQWTTGWWTASLRLRREQPWTREYKILPNIIPENPKHGLIWQSASLPRALMLVYKSHIV